MVTFDWTFVIIQCLCNNFIFYGQKSLIRPYCKNEISSAVQQLLNNLYIFYNYYRDSRLRWQPPCLLPAHLTPFGSRLRWLPLCLPPVFLTPFGARAWMATPLLPSCPLPPFGSRAWMVTLMLPSCPLATILLKSLDGNPPVYPPAPCPLFCSRAWMKNPHKLLNLLNL